MPFFKTGPGVDPTLVGDLLKQRQGIPPGTLGCVFGRQIPGRMTTMTCTCGGVLQEVRHASDVPMPPKPTHKKRRILKKRLKRWDRDVAVRKQVFAFMAAMQRPTYRCVACNRMQGFYATMARNLFAIEPLPESPVPFLRDTP